MASCLIINIQQLANVRTDSRLIRGKDLAKIPCIDNAYLLIQEDEIAQFGKMEELDSEVRRKPKEVIDARNATVIPCWCDSHTHLIFAGSREEEFVDKFRGLGYAEINAKGGG